MENNDLYFKMPVHDIFSLILNENLKEFLKIRNGLENILIKHSLFLSDVFILYHGVQEKFNIEQVVDYENAKIIMIFGDLSIEKLLDNLDKLSNLQYLYILDVDKDIEFPLKFKELSKLSTLILQNNTFKALPASIQNLENLTELEINNCYYLNKFPQEIVKLEKLQHLQIKNCQGFKILPIEIASLKKIHCMHFIDLENLESVFEIEQGQLSQLGMFEIVNCPRINTLSNSFNLLHHLENIKISGCNRINLRENQFKSLKKLCYLTFQNCVNITRLPLPDDTLNYLSIIIKNCSNIIYDDIVSIN